MAISQGFVTDQKLEEWNNVLFGIERSNMMERFSHSEPSLPRISTIEGRCNDHALFV
jgi:hypothetical protein